MPKQNHIFQKIRTGSQAEMLADHLSKRVDQRPGLRISTVAELEKAGMALKVSCGACGASAVFAGKTLKERFGATTKLKDIKDPCDCGSTAVSRMPEMASQSPENHPH